MYVTPHFSLSLSQIFVFFRTDEVFHMTEHTGSETPLHGYPMRLRNVFGSERQDFCAEEVRLQLQLQL